MQSEPKRLKHSNPDEHMLYQLDCSQCEIRASNEQHKECRQIMSEVSQFWRTTFKNHPDLNSLLEGSDQDCFNFLTEIDVEYFKGERSRYQLKFHFRPNPYFENDVLVKEISGSGDATESSSIPIKWKKGVT
ncbi:hypothetical protein PPYR_03859 [Photinus pyralis]|uniref:Uncharacterized protein n=1 Tax=Photinus pyralis TaxID=7054 RepID=A0A5N4AWN0_PHOPY|nr:protein SET-like [Photinus pyralis]KAB0801673.1 hypothetical protein PPYR_03859 [Photinus pyralis]